MANRVPLIVNPGALQIQELPTGDTLDLTDNDVTGIGSISANTASISGNLTVGGDLTVNGEILGANGAHPGLVRAMAITNIINL